MINKKRKICGICNKIDFKNRKDNHHLIPRHKNGIGKGRVWLCTECHTFLHLAESKGFCELPSETSRKFFVENSRVKGLIDQASNKFANQNLDGKEKKE